MKKRFLTLLALITLILVLGTTFVILNIEQAISSLDDLIGRYEKDRNCTRVLMEVKKVQHDGILHRTSGDTGNYEMLNRITALGKSAASCTSCHHPQPIADKIRSFSQKGVAFQDAMEKVVAHSDDPDHETMNVQAFVMGHELYDQGLTLFTKSSKQLTGETRVARYLAIKSKWLLYIITCSGLVMVIFTSFMLIRSFTRPLQSLLTATQKIKQGDFEYKVLGLKYEFGELANSFNAMSASLQTQMLQLQRNEQLVACGKIATTLAHEVRNPLAGIKAAMEVLSSESAVAQEDREILLQVVREVNRIEGLFTNMLEFARPKPPQLISVCLKEIIDRALLFTPSILNQEVTVCWDRENIPPTIIADPNHLYQVFLNLFLNATAAMPEGGTLSIVLTADPVTETIAVTISDTGCGIEESLLDDVFKPFFTTKAKGSGLGLATCKTLIDLHHGSIVAGNSVTGGALFCITLPISGGTGNAS
ncbi:MAG: HAMP domain-containing protein [Proteobacteria bacterium]|nr:HAMP domain-containing protein [Pseudomonadota bacterium]MBU1420185.1 HAMP domain-containing protein [Pseudomonadota bacterium]MBU1455514.1 HAMP domain-containing protein [Pseudomonadota bacterium]